MRQWFLLALIAGLVACTADKSEPIFDILIINGTVYDGSDNPPTQSNIGITGDRIAATNVPADAKADTVIDATGLLIMPGFIDPHTHAPLSGIDLTAHLNFLTQGVTTVIVGSDGGGIDNRESTVADLAANGTGANIAWFAGHGAIREAVMELEDREPTDDELDAMRERVAQEISNGALGLSTGLYYAPGSFASTDEVVALTQVAADMGGIYDTHLRDESSYTVGLLPAVDEAIEIARRTGIAVHISHIKALGKDTWGQSEEVVRRVNEARADGLSITANQYPWRASNVRLASALVPRWVMAGSRDDMRERLRDQTLADMIREEMTQNLARRGGPEAMLITTSDSAYRGMTLLRVSQVLETDPLTAAIELVETEDPNIASFVMNQDDIDTFRVQPWVMTGSDGGRGHPRFSASYPKAWRDFVRDREMLSAEQFVHRSSGLVADTLGLCDRGYLRPGYAADIAIINESDFQPLADFENPDRLSSGVVHLLVNGARVISDSEHHERRAGRVLAKTEFDCPAES
ncbi:MAG: amidohydrolase family protein [Woeseiaceae bacterium]|nr:amidohydrolase family protein [Woeseiaceae bacterium]